MKVKRKLKNYVSDGNQNSEKLLRKHSCSEKKKQKLELDSKSIDFMLENLSECRVRLSRDDVDKRGWEHKENRWVYRDKIPAPSEFKLAEKKDWNYFHQRQKKVVALALDLSDSDSDDSDLDDLFIPIVKNKGSSHVDGRTKSEERKEKSPKKLNTNQKTQPLFELSSVASRFRVGTPCSDKPASASPKPMVVITKESVPVPTPTKTQVSHNSSKKASSLPKSISPPDRKSKSPRKGLILPKESPLRSLPLSSKNDASGPNHTTQKVISNKNHKPLKTVKVLKHRKRPEWKKVSLHLPFKCKLCGKGLQSKIGFEYHMRTHSGERPYQCKHNECGERFRAKFVLKAHMRKHHAGRMPTAPRSRRGTLDAWIKRRDESNSAKVRLPVSLLLSNLKSCQVKLQRFDDPLEPFLGYLFSEATSDSKYLKYDEEGDTWVYPFIFPEDVLDHFDFDHFIISKHQSCWEDYEAAQEEEDTGVLGIEDDYLIATASLIHPESVSDKLLAKYECLPCSEQFSHPTLFLNHMRSLHKRTKLWTKCHECQMEIKSCFWLAAHINHHMGKPPFQDIRCSDLHDPTTVSSPSSTSGSNQEEKQNESNNASFSSSSITKEKTSSGSIVTSGSSKRCSTSFNFYEQARLILTSNVFARQTQTKSIISS